MGRHGTEHMFDASSDQEAVVITGIHAIFYTNDTIPSSSG
jgi:hypothetical protein